MVLALLAVFTIANGLFYLDALRGDYAAQGVGLRLGLATAVMMIAVIGGRIIPSFTRNWLARTNNPARPKPPMQRYDKLVLLFSLAILAIWVADPFAHRTGIALIVLGLLHTARLIRWQGHHTTSEPLVWVLHVSYAFIPLGAFALGLDQLLGNFSAAGAQHLWMAGAIGSMTLAVMSRATLGHTGHALSANRKTLAIYLSLFGAVLARVLTSIWSDMSYVSGILWLLAFIGFAWTYGPMLLRSKLEKKS